MISIKEKEYRDIRNELMFYLDKIIGKTKNNYYNIYNSEYIKILINKLEKNHLKDFDFIFYKVYFCKNCLAQYNQQQFENCKTGNFIDCSCYSIMYSDKILLLDEEIPKIEVYQKHLDLLKELLEYKRQFFRGKKTKKPSININGKLWEIDIVRDFEECEDIITLTRKNPLYDPPRVAKSNFVKDHRYMRWGKDYKEACNIALSIHDIFKGRR